MIAPRPRARTATDSRSRAACSSRRPVAARCQALRSGSAACTSGRVPVVFVHGLWLLPGSWDRWAQVFAEAGYAPVTPGWPDDPDTVAEAKQHPEVFAHKTVGQVADHYAELIGKLEREPAIVGHPFGGLLTQILAERGLACASVAIDPAPFQAAVANVNPWSETKVDSTSPDRGPLLIISGEKDTPSPGRSPTPPTRSRPATSTRSPRSSRFPAAATR